MTVDNMIHACYLSGEQIHCCMDGSS